MKSRRQAAILALVRRHRVASQEQLKALLHAEGTDVTQATLSRDVRELGLVKLADPEGGSHYAPPAALETVPPPLEGLVASLLLSAEGVGPLLVVKTPAGSANALGSALDHHAWPDVAGTIAGDDTLLIIAKSAAARERVAARLQELAAGG
ncbi:MAG: arginine repressor [Gemmatimonadota bacterium]|nr:arginine repressor [Gemmatimonadota bacterium]